MQLKSPISDDFGSRSPVIRKPFPSKNGIPYYLYTVARGISDDFGLRKSRHSETISAKKRYTLLPLHRGTRHFRRFGVKESRHSETISAKKRYTLIPLYRSTRHFRRFWVKEAPSFRNHFRQKTVYLNTCIP